MEEIGLQLSKENSIFIGSLDQRQVTVGMSRTPLMILCPYGKHNSYRVDFDIVSILMD